jgi:hypothetical protein
MKKRTERGKRLITIVGIGAVAAILAPAGVMAAGNVFQLKDGSGDKQAQIENGQLQVGGSVDVDAPEGASILAQGECNTDEDGYPDTGTVAAGKTVTGVVLTGNHGQSSITTLTVSAPSSSTAGNRLYTLRNGISQGYADLNEQLDFGPGIELSEQWSLSCTGQPGASQGDGLWFVYGY